MEYLFPMLWNQTCLLLKTTGHLHLVKSIKFSKFIWNNFCGGSIKFQTFCVSLLDMLEQDAIKAIIVIIITEIKMFILV
jgi:fluoride ion exporter CrcB/FEX